MNRRTFLRAVVAAPILGALAPLRQVAAVEAKSYAGSVTFTAAGLNQATFEFWRNRHSSLLVSSPEFRAACEKAFHRCVAGPEILEPRYIVFGDEAIDEYDRLVRGDGAP